NPEKMEGPHRRLASRTTHEWAYRGGQQPHQENQADRLRVPQLPVLPGPGAALRRKTQLGPVSHRHSPLNSEVPVMRRVAAAGYPFGGDGFDVGFVDAAVVVPERAA